MSVPAAADRPGAGTPGPGLTLLVDARGLYVSGIGRFLREILAVVLADPRFARVKLLGETAAIERFLAEARPAAGVAQRLEYAHPFYSPRAQLAWLRMRARGETGADVAFFPHFDAPVLAHPERSVVTVQDLIHFKVPAAFSAWKRRAAGLVLDRVARRARCVLTTSLSTRRDLLERVPEVAPKVEVIPLGVGSFFLERGGAGEPEPLGPPYLLCVGNRKPHKNLVAAVEALALLRGEIPELRLAIAGRVLDGWDRVVERARELGVDERVVDLPEVSDAELRSLYRNAEALLFPSLYEGFGLPVLEAMGCGTPVIASDRASIPEVAGDAALLVAPDDHEAMAEAVRRLRREPGLREALVRRGYERAASFPWERTARETVDLLVRVGSGAAVGAAASAARRAAPLPAR